MAVTKKILSFTALTVMILSYQNCMVDLAKSTPGAMSSSCAPDSSTLASFQTVEDEILLNTTTITGTTKDGCASCHGQNSSNSAKAVFMLVGTAGSETTTDSTTNFCTMQVMGQTILKHPSDASHSGGQYLQTDIPDYFNFISTNF